VLVLVLAVATPRSMAIRGPDAASFFPLTLLFSLGFFCARFVLDRLVYKVRNHHHLLLVARSDSRRVPWDLSPRPGWCCCCSSMLVDVTVNP
jgi:hypothetical protein